MAAKRRLPAFELNGAEIVTLIIKDRQKDGTYRCFELARGRRGEPIWIRVECPKAPST